MDSDLQNKYRLLVQKLKEYGSAAVAFSGGVDSTFLAKAAVEALGDKALAITVDSEVYPPQSIVECRNFAKKINIKLIEIKKSVFDIPKFSTNPPDRCYYCKKALFTLMLRETEKNGISVLMDGSNMDDLMDYRPGKLALEELQIQSPLRDLGFKKEIIRAISKELGLPTWDMQSFACLASRFPYHDEITGELLERTWKAEEILHRMGIQYYRVRNHGEIARIEVDAKGMDILMNPTNRNEVVKRFKLLGFSYITLDLQGFRTGSMNEVLDKS